MSQSPVIDNPWQTLRKFTDARIGVGRAGSSLPTAEHLQFQLDHARARDAVLHPLDWSPLHDELETNINTPYLHLHSQADDRLEYLQRPDLGRRLNDESVARLKKWREAHPEPIEMCVVIADGLSSKAVSDNAMAMLQQLLKDAEQASMGCQLICCVEQSRVGLGDEIGELTNAKYLVLMVGERPGLSAADSLGIYYTYLARSGCSDADRNCLSNIRPKGQSFEQASKRLLWLISESQRLQLSGVKLKDNSDADQSEALATDRNFLLPDK